MKVVAKEGAPDAAWVMSGNGRRRGQHLFSIGRQSNDGLNGLDQIAHACQVILGDKHR
ncbi:hypothetical protein D3C84_1214350 [compost metagenome]